METEDNEYVVFGRWMQTTSQRKRLGVPLETLAQSCLHCHAGKGEKGQQEAVSEG